MRDGSRCDVRPELVFSCPKPAGTAGVRESSAGDGDVADCDVTDSDITGSDVNGSDIAGSGISGSDAISSDVTGSEVTAGTYTTGSEDDEVDAVGSHIAESFVSVYNIPSDAAASTRQASLRLAPSTLSVPVSAQESIASLASLQQGVTLRLLTWRSLLALLELRGCSDGCVGLLLLRLFQKLKALLKYDG
ncbi:unnamed protein product [Closterium sp. NIES-53]